MTTVPLRQPYEHRAYLFDGERLLAFVHCHLIPPDAPLAGVAQVPGDRDWLALRTLTLSLQRRPQSYQVIPTKLERAPGSPALLHFNVVA